MKNSIKIKNPSPRLHLVKKDFGYITPTPFFLQNLEPKEPKFLLLPRVRNSTITRPHTRHRMTRSQLRSAHPQKWTSPTTSPTTTTSTSTTTTKSRVHNRSTSRPRRHRLRLEIPSIIIPLKPPSSRLPQPIRRRPRPHTLKLQHLQIIHEPLRRKHMRRPDVYVLVESLRTRVARPHLRVGHPAEDEDEEAVARGGGGGGG